MDTRALLIGILKSKLEQDLKSARIWVYSLESGDGASKYGADYLFAGKLDPEVSYESSVVDATGPRSRRRFSFMTEPKFADSPS
jgi:hypothetical protein